MGEAPKWRFHAVSYYRKTLKLATRLGFKGQVFTQMFSHNRFLDLQPQVATIRDEVMDTVPG